VVIAHASLAGRGCLLASGHRWGECVQRGDEGMRAEPRRSDGRAPAPARRGTSEPRRARRPRRHRAVVPCADLPPLQQAMERTGDRPLGKAGGLAHRGRPKPLRPRGREGRQDLSLTTGGRGGRRWDPWPQRGGRRRGLGLERWRGGRRPRGGRGGATGLACLQPRHRCNPKRFCAGQRHVIEMLAQRCDTCIHRGNRCSGTCGRGPAASPCCLHIQAVGPSCHPFLGPRLYASLL
jgi:hypothetical protein